MRKIKVLTQLDRLNWFSDTWINYHLRYFNKSDLVFLFESRFLKSETLKKYLNKFSFNDDEINIFDMGEVPLDYEERFKYSTPFINNIQSNLLQSNDVVIYLDIDELIYHHDLINLLNTFDSDYLVTDAIDITQKIDEEEDFDFTKKIKEQRRYMNVSMSRTWYRKNIVTKRPLDWQNGRHSEDPFTEDLYLIHLGKIDFKFLNEVNTQNIEMRSWVKTQNSFIDDNLKKYYNDFTYELIPEGILEILNI